MTILPYVSCRATTHTLPNRIQASVPATLNNGTDGLTNYQTLFEAVMSWHRLPSGQKKLATVEVLGGPIFHRNQIKRLYMGPYSATTMKA